MIEEGTLWIIAILVMIKLIIISAIVIRYRVSNHWQRHVFRFKVTLAIIGIFTAIIFYVWPESLQAVLA